MDFRELGCIVSPSLVISIMHFGHDTSSYAFSFWPRTAHFGQIECWHWYSTSIKAGASTSSTYTPHISHLALKTRIICQLVQLLLLAFQTPRADGERRCSPWSQMRRRKLMTVKMFVPLCWLALPAPSWCCESSDTISAVFSLKKLYTSLSSGDSSINSIFSDRWGILSSVVFSDFVRLRHVARTKVSSFRRLSGRPCLTGPLIQKSKTALSVNGCIPMKLSKAP